MLQIDNACIEFNLKPLFSNLSLHVQRGEMLCISGESGSGKTSLLRAVMGFVPLKEGSIHVDGTLLSAQTAGHIRSKITYIPQEPSFPLEWVKEMVQLPFDLKANHAKRFNQNEMFGFFNLLGLKEELYHKRINEISGGQKQRIMLAMSAMLEKPLYIIDEPTSALDADSAHKVLQFLRMMAEKGGTIVAVSHDKLFAQGCDRTFTLQKD